MTRDRRIPLPPGATSNAEIAAAYQPELFAQIGQFLEAATRLSALDPVLSDMVRIRGARTHDCRICKATRYRDALDAGVDDEMLAQVDNYEQSWLPDRIKVALRYTDAFNTRPGDIGPELVRQLRAEFTPDQIVALSLKIMRNSLQKQYVTLGIDVMPGVDVDSGAIAVFDFDENGRVKSIKTVSDQREASSV